MCIVCWFVVKILIKDIKGTNRWIVEVIIHYNHQQQRHIWTLPRWATLTELTMPLIAYRHRRKDNGKAPSKRLALLSRVWMTRLKQSQWNKVEGCHQKRQLARKLPPSRRWPLWVALSIAAACQGELQLWSTFSDQSTLTKRLKSEIYSKSCNSSNYLNIVIRLQHTRVIN